MVQMVLRVDQYWFSFCFCLFDKGDQALPVVGGLQFVVFDHVDICVIDLIVLVEIGDVGGAIDDRCDVIEQY